jgi:hypothetical protein
MVLWGGVELAHACRKLPQKPARRPPQDRPPHMQINRLFLIIILVGLVGVTGTIAWKIAGG